LSAIVGILVPAYRDMPVDGIIIPAAVVWGYSLQKTPDLYIEQVRLTGRQLLWIAIAICGLLWIARRESTNALGAISPPLVGIALARWVVIRQPILRPPKKRPPPNYWN
jgi:drug/metabolite transporter (DMT)-like permease